MERNVYGATPAEDIIVSNEADRLLFNIARWTKFLSILGFIILGVLAIFVISAGILITGMNEYAFQTHMYGYMPGTFSWMYAFLYLIVLGIYFVPIFYLYKFSTRIRKALSDRSSYTLTEALQFLNRHYQFIGILTIIGLIFFVISSVMMIMTMGV